MTIANFWMVWENFLDRFCMLLAGFGFSLLVLGVLIQIWVFSPGFGCSCLVFSVLGRFWVFLADFGLGFFEPAQQD